MTPAWQVAARLVTFMGYGNLRVSYGPWQGGDWKATYGADVGLQFGASPDDAFAKMLPTLRASAVRKYAEHMKESDGVYELLALPGDT